MESSAYRFKFERKMHEVFGLLEIDAKRALKIVSKEIDQQRNKVDASILGSLKVVNALCLEKNNRFDDSDEEIFGVLRDLQNAPVVDHYLLDTVQRTCVRMKKRNEILDKYLEVVEHFQAKDPNDKELTFTLYEGCLKSNKFAKAAKMAAKMASGFNELSFSLPQVQCLYMDSQKWLGGSQSPISLQLAVAFAEKYMAANQGQSEEQGQIPLSFSKLYLKLLCAQKAYDKATTFLQGKGKDSFDMWVERRNWQLRIYLESGQTEQAIQELVEMIRYNYTQVEQDFQSIFNLHEVMISLALPLIPSIKNKTLSLEQLSALLEVPAASDSAEQFPDFTPTDDFIKGLNASFEHYANSFQGQKTVNALNCRKSAILSQMLLRHKALVLGGLAPVSQEQSGPIFKDLLIKYSKIFASVSTLVFDLAPYLQYLPECVVGTETNPEECKSELIAMFDQEEAQVAAEDKVRKARILLSNAKMQRMLGHTQGVQFCEKLLGQYLEFSKLDGKPEKGERKIADDFVLLLEEVLQEASIAEKGSTSSKVSQIDVFRVGVLEYALSLSPYNFDIQLALATIYDSHGLSVQYKQAIENLTLKGIQRESMGYLQLRHSIEWGATEGLFKPFFNKYDEFWLLNEKDLAEMRHKSFQADNWEQVENFTEYGDFLSNSYFHQVALLLNRMHDQIKASQSNPDAAQECFSGNSSVVKTQLAKLASSDLNSTQDIKVLLPKFSIATKGEITEDTRPVGHLCNTFIDKLNRIALESDPHYSKFKNERQSNFKPNVVNTLGLFENQGFFKKLLSQIDQVTNMYENKKIGLTTAPSDEEEKKEEESKEALPENLLSHILYTEDEMAQFDYAGLDQQELAKKLASINCLLSATFKAYSSMKNLSKPAGQAAVDTAAQILDKVQPALQELLTVIADSSAARSINMDDQAAKSQVASPVGLKWFFMEMLLFGGLVVPALDAMSQKLRTTVPSFKKKKGAALPPQVEQVQKDVWNATKTQLKALQSSIEQQVALIEAALRDSFNEATLLEGVDSVSFINCDAIENTFSAGEQYQAILGVMREKAIEFSNEKSANVANASAIAQAVSKQIKGIVDTRFK